MLIRKRSFVEVFLPLMMLAFLGQGTRFIDIVHLPAIRFVLLFLIFFYLFLNKKILSCVENIWWLFFLVIYLLFCMATTLWSEIPILSFSKSTAFAFANVTAISVGCLWVIKFGFQRSLDWLFPIALVALISGVFGGKANDQIGNVMLYGGLSGNPNNFGFLAAIVSSFLLWRCYCVKENKKLLFFWIISLILDTKFLFASFSRSAIANFLCIVAFFVLSLSFSKKMLMCFTSFFSIILLMSMMPVSLIESMATKYVLKGEEHQIQGAVADKMLHSREEAWQKSLNDAVKGGLLGAGFSVSIGDSDYHFGKFYGREKGNAQLAILEETGVVGLLLSSIVIFLFFTYAFSYYIRLHGEEKVIMGLVLGSIIGLLMESLVEAWWDSLAPEVICFWTLIGVVFGMIHLKKRELYANMRSS